MKPLFQPTTLEISIEMLYSIFVILMCSLIYFKTKEIYELSNHKGIKYFRIAFVFFGITYLTRLLFQFYLTYLNTMPWHGIKFYIINMLIFVFTSSMAIITLTYSTVWKKFKLNGYKEVLALYVVAILIVLSFLFTRSLFIFFISQIILFIIAIFMSFISAKKSKKKSLSSFHVIYFLLFLFWICNIALMISVRFISHLKFPLYALSSLIFLLITYKVINKIRTKK